MVSKLIILAMSACFLAAISGTPSKTCTKQNEHYLPQGSKRAPNCETECSTLGDTCYTTHFVEPSGCYCIEGYAKDDNKDCIPIAECPPKMSIPFMDDE